MKSLFCAWVFLLLVVQQVVAQPATRFLENKGQWDRQAEYLLQRGNVNLWITNSGMVYDIWNSTRLGLECVGQPRVGQVIRISILGAQHSLAIATDSDSSRTNYFIGKDPTKWVTGVRSFADVTLRNEYPGINVAFSLDREMPRYDFVLSPGADPDQIQMRIEGADSVYMDSDNDLVLSTALGNIEERGLFAYQEVGRKRQSVSCRFRVSQGNVVSFQVGSFDRTKELVIDPLIFSTYLGGAHINAIAVDGYGNSYVTGWVESQKFPVTTGVYQFTNNGSNAFISKLNSSGTALVYSTYLGGSGYPSSYAGFWGDGGNGIAVDSAGNAYVTGVTGSTDFPVTSGAYQSASKAFVPNYDNAFVTKLNPTGTALIYSTYLGGSDGNFDGLGEYGSGIAVDSVGEAYIVGTTSSSDFPVTKGAFQTKNSAFTYDIESEGDAVFITKINARGSGLIYSTFLCGSKLSFSGPYPSVLNEGVAIALDRIGDAFVTGATNAADFPTSAGAFQSMVPPDSIALNTAFVTALDPTGRNLLFSSYLGGSGSDAGLGIGLDSTGNVFVVGTTSSGNFPVTLDAFQTSHHGVWDGFVTKLNASGSALNYSTFLDIVWPYDSYQIGAYYWYYGGNPLAVDRSGDAFVTGMTDTLAVQSLPGAIQTSIHGGSDAILAELSADGSALRYSTYLGGTKDDFGASVALDSNSVYVAGTTHSTDFPVTSGAFDSNDSGNSFIAKISPVTRYLAVDSGLRDFGQGSLCRSTDTSIVFTNAGQDTLRIKSVLLNGNYFSLVSSPSAGVLMPEASDTVIVAYLPNVGRDTAYLTIVSDAANDSSITIPLAARTASTPILGFHAACAGGVPANHLDTLTLYSDSSIQMSGIQTMEMSVTFNGDLLSEQSLTSFIGAATVLTSHTGNHVTLHLIFNVTAATLDSSKPIAQIIFRTMVAPSDTTEITVADPVFNSADLNYAKCVLAAKGTTVAFSLDQDCSSPLLSAVLNNKLALSIESIEPNPASSLARIAAISTGSGPITCQLFDMLGRAVISFEVGRLNPIILNTSSMAEGIYMVVLKEGFASAQGRIVVER